MSVTNGIVAFLFIVTIIIAVIVLTPFIVRSLSVKTNFYVIGGYLAVLIVLSLICLLLPGGVLLKNTNSLQEAKSIDSTKNIYEMILAGNFRAPNGFTKAENNFAPQSGNVTVTSGNALQVYVGTKGLDVPDNGDGKIDVYCYICATVNINDINFTPRIEAPTVKYSDNNLIIKATAQKIQEYCKFDDKYAAQQFFGTDHSLNSGLIISDQIFVLLPPGVTANGEGYQTLDSLKPSAE